MVEALLSYAKLRSPLERMLGLAETVPDQPERLKGPRPCDQRVEVRLGPDRVQQLIAEYRSGTPTRKLAKHYGISKTGVTDLLTRQGITIRTTKRMSESQLAEAKKLYESGWPLKSLGERFGFSGTTIRRGLMDSGVQLRPRTGWKYDDTSHE